MFRNYQVPNAPLAYTDFSVPPPKFFPTNELFPSNDFFELELNSWLSQIKINKPKQHIKLNVSSIKMLLTKYFKLIKELEKLLLYLKVGEASLEEDDWNDKCSEIEKKKKELNEIVEKFDDPDFLAAIKFSTNRAKKKRAQRKKKQQAWKEKKNEREIFRSQEHKRIDLWLENKQFEIEKVKREESVKREADLVLSDVRLKTSEAKKTLALLNALEKLRSVRVRQRLANGKRVFEEETNSFTQVIEKLKKLWTEQLEEYKQEETGLQVMLNDAEVERKNVELAKLKKIAHQWTDVIFGKRDKLPHFLQLNSFDDYVSVRSIWDKYVSDEPHSSSIPIGWVVPVKPSSSDWEKYLSPN